MCNRGTRKPQPGQGQTLVEFALVAPLLLLMVFLTIDFGRLVYTYGAIAWAAREGARLASLQPQETSDCAIYQSVEAAGQGFPLSPDPNSLVGNSDPNNPTGTLRPTLPPAGQGYIYVWPAVSTARPQDSGANCMGRPRSGGSGSGLAIHDVAVQVQFTYTPMVPLIGSFIGTIPIKTISVFHSEY